MVMDPVVVLGVVREELRDLTRGDQPDLVTTERHASVYFSVLVGVASGACHQVQATVTTPAHVRPFVGFRMDAARITPIPGVNHPETSEVRIEDPHDRVGNQLKLLGQVGLFQQVLLQSIQTLDPPFGLCPLVDLSFQVIVSLAKILRTIRNKILKMISMFLEFRLGEFASGKIRCDVREADGFTFGSAKQKEAV